MPTDNAVCVCGCGYEKKRKRVFVSLPLSQSFCLTIRVHVGLWFYSLLLSICLRDWLPCLFLLSQSFSSPRPTIYQFTLRTPSTSRLYHHFPHLDGFHIFRPLYFVLPTFTLLSNIAWSQGPLSLYLSSYYVFLLFLCTSRSPALPGYSFSLPLSPVSALDTFFLAFSYHLVSVAFLSHSMLHICLSIPCLCDSSLAFNLFMFSLVLL